MRRNIVMFAAGSRGDIQPCVALGRTLAAGGDAVRVIASARYKAMVDRAGLELFPLTADPAEILNSDAGQELQTGGRNPVKFLRNFRRIIAPMAERMLAEFEEACRDADLILCPTLGFLGRHLGEHLGVPWALIHFQPSQRTREFPHPLLPQARLLGGPANRASFDVIDQVAWQLARPFINPWRRRDLRLAGLPPRGPMYLARRERIPVLCCFSEAVVPRPADWPSYVHLTGYWFLDEPDHEPPAGLADFIDAGPPPVYVGFGSMVPNDPERAGRMVRRALRMAGLRAVVAASLAGADPSDDVFAVDDIPHAWLFPRMAAVVHHGGAGTTAAGLRAGVPTVVCPFFGDQPYWGDRIAALGAGPPPLPFRTLSAPRLAGALRRATRTPPVRAAAKSLGERIAAEDGPRRARTILDRY